MPKKHLKDYLHLYMGCEGVVTIRYSINPELKVREVKCLLKGVIGENAYLECFDKNGNKWNDDHQTKISNFKPILRPLSDMKLEEQHHAFTIRGENAFDEFEGETTKYLLSKHFDIFRLIEDSLAIDKTKQ